MHQKTSLTRGLYLGNVACQEMSFLLPTEERNHGNEVLV